MFLATTIYDASQEYAKQFNWDTLPIPPDNGNYSKVPTEGWPTRAANRDYSEHDYAADNTNLGVLLGSPNNLTDVDCDDLATLPIAADILGRLFPSTCIFGRKSNPNSHYLYYTDENLPTEKFTDPMDKKSIIEYRCVTNDGHRGRQTVVPPSIHQDTSEPVIFTADHDPSKTATVKAQRLKLAVKLIAALTILVKHSPVPNFDYHAVLTESGEIVVESLKSALEAYDTKVSAKVFDLLGIPKAKQTSASPGTTATRHTESTEITQETIRDCAIDIATAKTGNRHDILLALTGIMAKSGWSQKQADDVLIELCNAFADIDPTFVAAARLAKARTWIKDAGVRHDQSQPVAGWKHLSEHVKPEVVEKWRHSPLFRQAQVYTSDDIGNAQRFADKHVDDIRYCPEDKAWYVWERSRWTIDHGNHVQELAKTISDDLHAEAQAKVNNENLSGKDAEKVSKWANRSRMHSCYSAIPKSASSIATIIIKKDRFDTHDHLLNSPNGMVDLYTGELLGHDRNLFLTQQCPTEFDPKATHPDWDNVIEAVCRNHSDLPAFLRRFVGYISQGDKCEEHVALCYGQGGSGKGTFWTTIQKTLGADLVRNVSPNSLLRQDRSGSGVSSDIARLAGSRLAIVSEFGRNSKLEEGFVKAASGNDTITARSHYTADFEFRPTFQFVFQSNFRPKFNSTDTGNQRRYIEIPFDNVIAEDPLLTLDMDLKTRLGNDPKVRKAVLAWIVAGCVEWRKSGLQLPECVKAATQELFKENDDLGEFLAECVIRDPKAKVKVADLWNVYVKHCQSGGEEPCKDRMFNKMIKERGGVYKDVKSDRKVLKAWFGLKLTLKGERLIETEEDRLAREEEPFKRPQNNKRPFMVESPLVCAS